MLRERRPILDRSWHPSRTPWENKEMRVKSNVFSHTFQVSMSKCTGELPSTGAFKTKCAGHSQDIIATFATFGRAPYRTKSLKTRARGTSWTERIGTSPNNHTTVREIACRSVFLANMYVVNGPSWPLPGHFSENAQVQNSYNTQRTPAGLKKSTPLCLGATQVIVFIILDPSCPFINKYDFAESGVVACSFYFI